VLGSAWAGFRGASPHPAAAVTSAVSSQRGSAAEPSLPRHRSPASQLAVGRACPRHVSLPGGKGPKPALLGGGKRPAQRPGTARRGDARDGVGRIRRGPFSPPTPCPEPRGRSRLLLPPSRSWGEPRSAGLASSHRLSAGEPVSISPVGQELKCQAKELIQHGGRGEGKKFK